MHLCSYPEELLQRLLKKFRNCKNPCWDAFVITVGIHGPTQHIHKASKKEWGYGSSIVVMHTCVLPQWSMEFLNCLYSSVHSPEIDIALTLE